MDYKAIVAELEREKDEKQSDILNIETAITAIKVLQGFTPSKAALTPPAKIGGRGRPRSTKSQAFNDPNDQEVLRSHDDVFDAAKKQSAALELDPKERKRQSQRRWMAKKYAKEGKVYVPRTTTSTNGTIPSPKTPANKFSLEREFDLGDKDVRLMHSYMMSWKATGRLTNEEENVLRSFEGRILTNLNDLDRLSLRNSFYGCRSRVIVKTKLTSKL